MIKIRNEKESDYKAVEEITRKAFYNLYVPGCVEHYLVHTMRGHEDFIPELDFVIELDDQVIGNIMYTKARLVDEAGTEKEILTFGPVSITPEYQRIDVYKRQPLHRRLQFPWQIRVYSGSVYGEGGGAFADHRKEV